MATKKRSEIADAKAPATGTAKPIEMTPAKLQVQTFEEGVKLFREQKFAEAKERFAAAETGPLMEVRHNARLHAQVCDRRLNKHKLELHTAEDHYNYGVERLNARDFDPARKHLDIALALDPEADHIHYAAAAAHAISGDLPRAYETLKRAIELNPRNRGTARHDSDFAALLHHPVFGAVFQTERA